MGLANVTQVRSRAESRRCILACARQTSELCDDIHWFWSLHHKSRRFGLFAVVLGSFALVQRLTMALLLINRRLPHWSRPFVSPLNPFDGGPPGSQRLRQPIPNGHPVIIATGIGEVALLAEYVVYYQASKPHVQCYLVYPFLGRLSFC